jgi:thiamine-monophosphate kinase
LQTRPGPWSETPSKVTEFELIERIRARARVDASVVTGIGDDAAVLQPTPDHVLLATTDSLVLDRHFTASWPPADVGHLALSVNLSDLAAMGACPRWALLSLTLPQADAVWLDGFLDGFCALADRFEVRLVGGNISSGPLNIGVQLLGEARPEGIVSRRGGEPGDVLAVTGTLGDAAAALAEGPGTHSDLLARLHRPEPRVATGQALAGQVKAMIDLSDGLLADLGHLLGSSLGARLELDRLPTSQALRETVPNELQRWQLQLNGGNDYELLMALGPDRFEQTRTICQQNGLDLTMIGRIAGPGPVQCLMADGQHLEFDHGGWDHFKQR